MTTALPLVIPEGNLRFAFAFVFAFAFALAFLSVIPRGSRGTCFLNPGVHP